MFETTKLGGDKQPKWSSTNNRNIQYGHWLKDVEGKIWPETHGFQIQLGSKPPKPMGTLEFNQPICLRCVDYEGVIHNFDDLSSVSFLQNAINCAGMVVNAHFQTNPNIKLMLKYLFNIQCNHMCWWWYPNVSPGLMVNLTILDRTIVIYAISSFIGSVLREMLQESPIRNVHLPIQFHQGTLGEVHHPLDDPFPWQTQPPLSIVQKCLVTLW